MTLATMTFNKTDDNWDGNGGDDDNADNDTDNNDGE